MKALFVLIAGIIAVTASAQVPPNPADKLQDLKTLNIYADGNNQVVIGRAFINQSLPTKLFILSAKQTKDASGAYNTVLEFGNYETSPLPAVKLSFGFDKKIESVNHTLTTGNTIISNLENNRKGYVFEAGQISRPAEGNIFFSITLKSKDPVSLTLSGIDGILNQ